MKVIWWWKFPSDESYVVMKVKIVQEVKRSDGLWRFACGDVWSLNKVLRLLFGFLFSFLENSPEFILAVGRSRRRRLLGGGGLWPVWGRRFVSHHLNFTIFFRFVYDADSLFIISSMCLGSSSARSLTTFFLELLVTFIFVLVSYTLSYPKQAAVIFLSVMIIYLILIIIS